MPTCPICKGSGECQTCHGTGSAKRINPHPAPWDVDDDGEVECFECKLHPGKCSQCKGSGEVNDDD
jgi:hypothetical protein